MFKNIPKVLNYFMYRCTCTCSAVLELSDDMRDVNGVRL